MRSQSIVALAIGASANVPPTPVAGKIFITLSKINLILECDWTNDWYQHRWGNEQACFKDMGHHGYGEAAAVCREEGASLPLPKTPEELESFQKFNGLEWGLIVDATDLNEDGAWEDSYGNSVTYFPPFYYYPVGQQRSTYSYQYMSIREKNGNVVSYVTPDNGSARVFCQLPLDLPSPPIYEPPTPIEG